LQDKTTGIKYIYISNGGITRLEEWIKIMKGWNDGKISK
jgi:hypothetical protein